MFGWWKALNSCILNLDLLHHQSHCQTHHQTPVLLYTHCLHHPAIQCHRLTVSLIGLIDNLQSEDTEGCTKIQKKIMLFHYYMHFFTV